MLDNLFNTIFVLSFLALCAYGAMSNQPVRGASEPQLVTQLERVVIVGQSTKTPDPV